MDYQAFVEERVAEIRETVGEGLAINALSGGVDSSVVTVLGHRALGDRLKTVFIDSALMREGEPQRVHDAFADMCIPVEVVDARAEFLGALAGLTDPEKKRNAVTNTFYKRVFGNLVRESGATYLLHGTILTDIEETVAGIKRQHNILAQVGIDPQKAFGYSIIEPLVQLRKDGVRKIAKATGLPSSAYNRIPFPGPALAARVIDEVTPAKIKIVRTATEIVEKMLDKTSAFQYMAILHNDRVTGMRDGKRDFGLQIEIRCWDSVDARKAIPTQLPYSILTRLAARIVKEVPGVVSVTYNIAAKPPSTMEVV